MTITSPAFAPGSPLPVRFARGGNNVSPPLTIEDVPAGAQSLALIMDEPDAEGGPFTHWIAFNLHPVDQQIPEAASLLGSGVRHGRNGWNETRYGGPLPPSGAHRYVFRIVALDRRLPLPDGVDRGDVDRSMTNHVIEEATLIALSFTPGKSPP